MNTQNAGATQLASHRSDPKALRASFLVTAICWGMVVLEGYDLISFSSVLPVLTADKNSGFTDDNSGWVAAAVFIGSTFGALASGWLSDRYGRRPVAIGALVIFSIFTMAAGFTDGPWQLGIARFLAGLGIGAVVPAASALTLEFAVPEIRTLLYTLMLSGVPTGGVLAALAGINIMPDYGWRWVFFIGILPAIIALPFLIKQLPESPTFLESVGRHDEAQALRDRFGLEAPAQPVAQTEVADEETGIFAPSTRVATILFGCASFFGLLTWFGLGTWLPGMMRKMGYDLTSSLMFLLILNIGAIIGSLFIGYATDRFGSKKIVVPTYLMLGIALMLLINKWPQAPLMAFVVLAGIGGHGGQILINRYVSRAYTPRNRAKGLGWSLGFGRIGTIVGPIVIGYVIRGGHPTWGFIFFAIAAILASVFLFFVPRTPAMEVEEQ